MAWRGFQVVEIKRKTGSKRVPRFLKRRERNFVHGLNKISRREGKKEKNESLKWNGNMNTELSLSFSPSLNRRGEDSTRERRTVSPRERRGEIPFGWRE